MNLPNKITPVTCAIIEQDEKILCAQRSEKMKHPLKWEFPGGKIEKTESPGSCLQREIKEELGVEIEILEQLPTSKHTYPGNIIISLLPFRCKITSGKITLAEHKQIKWLSLEELRIWIGWRRI
ncbi:(deoxy)nucleoside triphosphate pyrophosphohydrolase [Autumnicola musiva]|uniref:8-oxo-dGTP diphosphatase n=1 Tax=Autumnicola musiva TaxID=3075589 RepID=A0ABU3D9J1_9FLAO|nr:(deoxy)nucleoside triphosphate pyrophosphohydrolase [Zunongwangia sp. F117]MDT0678005.1 (deoxy)nucleoside triphosphate pyrophosphohydrolase [Zunongwangia sp. F117]